MNEFATLLEPSAMWEPGLRAGANTINDAANRIVDPSTGRFVGALVRSQGLSDRLADAPGGVAAARAALSAAPDTAKLLPMLEQMQVINTIGALASVANLGVSIVGFAVVLRRLSRIEGKLDDLLDRVGALQDAVRAIRVDMSILSMARIRAAAESLDRALAAETASSRRELATRARSLFQEARLYHLEMWRRACPWEQSELALSTCLEMQSRYTACAIGEIQAEFLVGDLGALRHAAASAARDLKEVMSLDAVRAYRARSDAACAAGGSAMAVFQRDAASLSSELLSARAATLWSAQRLESFVDDADLAVALHMEPHVLMRLVRDAPGVDVYVIRLPKAA